MCNKLIKHNFNFCKLNALIFKIGFYEEGIKQGLWKITYDNIKLGGGIYNQNGRKEGFWRKLFKLIGPQIFVVFEGKYNDGKKQDQWNYLWIEPLNRNNKIIGGGNYNIEGQKLGQWKTLSKKFTEFRDFQVIYTGLYCSGIKQGQWDICFTRNQKASLKRLGGGLYENGVKIQKWIKLSNNFSEFIQNNIQEIVKFQFLEVIVGVQNKENGYMNRLRIHFKDKTKYQQEEITKIMVRKWEIGQNYIKIIMSKYQIFIF
ncbi:unnamed protein product [Paramecium sonneborni]|uniref:Uncharacterized protein n=1 Tax=Paramecium sonneborni TaxID=65129 RepID=A0A8S1RE97_9CILI|nr:unnamed protein product [Paramecium sonneborni]